MSRILYWLIWILYRIIYFISEPLLALCNGGKGKTVPPIKNPLLLKSAKKLSEEIRKGKLKSEDVVQAYIDRIKEVEPYINAVVQDRFYEALNEARIVDELIQSGKWTQQQLESEKPLLGVPFTVKLVINVKGLRNTGGSKFYEDVVAKEDAPTVTSLKDAGGIVIANTNAPEFGIAFESNNLLHGKTCNPYDTNRTAGGSSGGEAALIGSGGSLIGIGNDAMGSLRVPAHFTGIFSHKPTVGMIPNGGVYINLHPLVENFIFSGPMCRYSEDLVLLTKILSAGEANNLKLERKVNLKELKIFYSTTIDDPMTLPVDKEIIEAMHEAMSYFSQKYDIKTEEIRIPQMDQTMFMSFYNVVCLIPDTISYLTSGKQKHLNIISEAVWCLLGKSPFHYLTVLVFAAKKIIFRKKYISYYKNLLKELDNIFDNLLDENSIFLLPCFPVTAPYHHWSLTHITNVCYTGTFNVVGLPVSVCPCGLNKNGMPKGIQIIGRKNNDALTLACAVELEKLFGGWIPPAANKTVCVKEENTQL